MSKYGSENFALEFRDLQATTMSLDRNGQFALLAGRKYLTVISLDTKPGEVVVRIPFGGKYEISNTQWSHINDNTMFAVASSQRCDIFELTDGSELKCIYRLKCHTRVITDLDWSTLAPSLLATSSFDTYVHVWDIRCPREPGSEKPQLSLSALDGASQVRWNKWKVDSLASCDGGHVKIWDIRRPNIPSEYIAAHASKINGLEWITKDVVVTAAQDCTVKFNRIQVLTPAKAKGPCLTLNTPVWRARPAPFGRGIMTQCVPILRRDSGLISLWDWKRFSSPIFTFQAHDIVEFGWKTSGNCELLTWSRDQTLRVWSLPREVIELCGENMWPSTGQQPEVNVTNEDDVSLNQNEKVEVLNKISPKKEGSIERKSRKAVTQLTKRDQILQDEFESVSETMPDNVNFEHQEVERGILRFSWKPDPKGRSVSCVVLSSFPHNYPAAAPTFLVTSAANEVDKNQLVKNLKHTAQQCMRKSEPCLNACINQFSEFMNLIKALDEPSNLFRFPSRGVSNVPFPRTSGARFCFVGVLVCFGRPTYLRRVKSSDAGTPRSLSALGPFLSQVAHDDNSMKSRRSKRGEKRTRAGLVTIIDVSTLLPFNKEVASNYKHISKWNLRKSACIENSQIANTYKKPSVSHAWQAASVVSNYTSVTNQFSTGPHEQAMISICDTFDDDEDINWITYHPLGSELIQSMITHYAHVGDVQTAATVACHFTVFDESTCPRGTFQEYSYSHYCGTSSTIDPTTIPQFPTRNNHHQHLKQPRLTLPKWWTKGLGSPYHTVHGSDTLHGVVVNPLSDNFFRPHRSNSWSDSLDDNKAISALHSNENNNNNNNNNMIGGTKNNGKFGTEHGVILDPSFHRVFDSYKKSYAEILYRWGLLQQRAEIVKCLTEGIESSFLVRSGVDYVILCKTCKQRVRGPQCQTCKKVVSICSICHIPAKGLCTYCSSCGHGGHAQHMLEWFKIRPHCPTGCGCTCIQEHNRNYK